MRRTIAAATLLVLATACGGETTKSQVVRKVADFVFHTAVAAETPAQRVADKAVTKSRPCGAGKVAKPVTRTVRVSASAPASVVTSSIRPRSTNRSV